MPSTNTESPAPLKNMDIKAAFLAASNRKRKASPSSTQLSKAKNIKLNIEEKAIDVTETVEADAVICTSDSKENTDLNTVQTEDISLINQKLSTGSIENKVLTESTESAEHCNESINDEVIMLTDSDDLNSSLNKSANLVSDEVNELSKDDLNTSIDSKNSLEKEKTTNNQSQNSETKKRKRMTPEEAKQKSLLREEKQKEKLLKKKDLETQKLQKKMELEKRKQQKIQEKLEKEEEKKEKARLRQEKKELEEKEKLLKQKEIEEKKIQRQEAKEEEKKRKEDLRLKREEEQRKAEEEKKEKEEKEKLKREKAKAAFFKFFKKENTSPPPQSTVKEGAFQPFQISEDMTLAPVVPVFVQEKFDKSKLDNSLKFQENAKDLYLQILKSGDYKDVRQRKRVLRERINNSDVIILDKSAQEELFMKAKLLQFCENVRPPYWGTWRKKSKCIGPRKPFGQDEIFDYEVDSDEEWDEGGPGESLSGTENEQESEDDYEVDNEFFVPHGYLSAEEEKEDEEVENDPEKQKALLKIKQQEFETERKKKTTELKPIILGCFFENSHGLSDTSLRTFLTAYSAELLTDIPIPTRFSIKKASLESTPTSNANSPTSNTSGKKGKQERNVPEEALPHLIRLLHGNPRMKAKIAAEFQNYWQQYQESKASDDTNLPENPKMTDEDRNETSEQMTPETSENKLISKRQIIFTINKISEYGKGKDASRKPGWWVHDDIREKYGILDEPSNVTDESASSSSVKKDKDVPAVSKPGSSIKKFLVS